MHSVSSIYYIVTIRRNKYQLSQGKTKSRMAYCFLSSAESLSPWSNEPLEKVIGSISVYNPSLLATLASVIPRAGGWIRSINCELGAFHSGCQRSVFWVPGWYLSWTLTRGGAFVLRFLSSFSRYYRFRRRRGRNYTNYVTTSNEFLRNIAVKYILTPRVLS